MNKILLLVLIPFIGLSNVSADETGTGTNDTSIGIINTSPIVVDDEVITTEDTVIEIMVTSNDIDTENDTLTITDVSDEVNGEANINDFGTGIIFTPDEDFYGTGSFVYEVSDGEFTDTGSVVVTIESVNDNPEAMDDTFIIKVNETVDLDLISNDTDIDGDTLILSSLGIILNGSGVVNTTSTGVIFTPNTDFVGDINFVYIVTDGKVSVTGNVEIKVELEEDENNIPEAEDDEVETDINDALTFDPRDNDTDEDGDILSISGITDAENGIVTFTSVSITYTPSEDFYGDDEFEYTITDGNGGGDMAKVKVTVVREEDDEEDEDDDINKFKEKHVVKVIQKEFISKFKKLKEKYKHLMKYEFTRNKYLKLKEQLREEYLLKLKVAVNPDKKYEYSGEYKKDNYKNTYNSRYGFKLENMSDSKLENLIEKIDNMLAEVNESITYSDTIKEKYNTMLMALRELAEEHMDNNENILNLDSLFE